MDSFEWDTAHQFDIFLFTIKMQNVQKLAKKKKLIFEGSSLTGPHSLRKKDRGQERRKKAKRDDTKEYSTRKGSS